MRASLEVEMAPRQLRAGLTVLLRHLRNSGGDPARLLWIARRALQLVLAGRLGAVLQRHSVLHELYADYPRWLERYDRCPPEELKSIRAELDAAPARPRITVLIPTHQSRPELLCAAVHSARRQHYAPAQILLVDDGSTDPGTLACLDALGAAGDVHVHRRAANGGIAACLNSGLELITTDFVAFLDHDDLLHETALLHVAHAIVRNPQVVLVYTDEDMIDEAGRRSSPHFKPEWNGEWIRTTNYILHLMTVRTATARELGGFRSEFDGVQDWDFVVRMTERARLDQVVRVPRVLYHWRTGAGSTASGVYQKTGVESAQRRVMTDLLARRNIRGTIAQTEFGWRIRYALPEPAPLVSIIVLTRDRVELLQRCVTGVLERTAYVPVEVVLVDHDSSEPEAVSLLRRLESDPRVRVVRYSGEFNYARQCNLGARHARGDVLVLLNNDIEVIEPGWLAEMVGHAIQHDVGIVGALLLYPDFTIQHAGVIVGLNGTADRPYLGYRRGYAGIVGRAQAAQDVSAVITACAAMRRTVFEALRGFDETFPISHNDVDLCLRTWSSGYRVVFTPHAELLHRESASRGLEVSPPELARAAKEAEHFVERWSAWIENDPMYNPNLTRQGQAFALAYPPRPTRTDPRRNRSAIMGSNPSG